MPATDPRVADAVARHAHLRVACALMLLAWAATCLWGAALGGETSRAPAESGGMFLQSPDGATLWKQTLATVAADWPIVRIIEPDFAATPPREGLIESAWVEPPSAGQTPPGSSPLPSQAWSPQRQRVVVRVMPAAEGAWIDAIVETQSIADLTADRGPGEITLTGGWQTDAAPGATDNITTMLAARMAPTSDPVYALPPLDGPGMLTPRNEPPWARARYPRAARFGYKVLEDYRNFYSCDGLVCLTAAFGAGALMANTGFDTTMQAAWQRSVVPTDLGTFFADCKDIGEGRYALGVFGAAGLVGLALEGRPGADIVGEWGSRSLRMFIVGAPPVYFLQLATGASRPSDLSSAGSQWKPFTDDNGVSGHAFVGAIPFLAAADMVESPVAKGALYVCSTFVGFSRMTTDSHFPSQVFLGWYLAWASSRAVSGTEMHFAGMEVSVVPLPMADLGGLAVEGRW
ncbi:MAG: phosphatase PAP2 family protein [Planctomycetes bacterium]|nr:phosphatase PAP2 family protein [Planctomycetota bacterium]